jgi:hypothetical protein
MTKLDILVDNYPDFEFLKADGFDDAVMGIFYNRWSGEMVLVYSRCKCIEILMKRDGMSEDEALEYFDFNVEGAYMGAKTPIWVDDTFIS